MQEVKISQKDILSLNKASLAELGEYEAKRLLEEGFHDSLELTIFSRKYTEFLTAFTNALKEEAIAMLGRDGGKASLMGAKIAIASGITYYDYEQDSTYADLKRKLEARKDLLKVALKQDDPIIDGDSAEVPKVGIKRQNADSIKVTL